jgi:hypothetical protein
MLPRITRFGGSALQDVELMPEHKDFGFQRSPRPE